MSGLNKIFFSDCGLGTKVWLPDQRSVLQYVMPTAGGMKVIAFLF